jgi:AcrR family transcriptional regulator
MNSSRPYVMRARADATAQTRDEIVRAAYDLTVERASLDVVLADIAARAGVSVQTVLRHFGSREGLFDAVGAMARAEVLAERATRPGDVRGATRHLVAHYERMGGFMLGLLGQAARDERAAEIVASGKGLHRQWVTDVFAAQISTRPPRAREALVDLLVVATDLYTWALLRRDRGLSPRTVEQRMTRLIDAVLREEH